MAIVNGGSDSNSTPGGTTEPVAEPSVPPDLGRYLTRPDARFTPASRAPWPGVYPGVVTDVEDPDDQGRVLVRLPWLDDSGDGRYEAWARLATLMAGADRGTWFIPDVDDEVLVAFEAGDPSRPYVIGALWNGQDAPPESMDGGGKNDIKTIQSRNGVRVSLDDSDGQEMITIETPGGQKFQLKDGPASATLDDANGNSVKLEAQGITVNASAKVVVNGSVIELSASSVTIDSPMVTTTAVLRTSTLIADSVVSASYTPGAGNIW